jgi:CheY-like chemotaxis protein
MDVQMPELDGFEASREINRRWPGELRPRIVAMTANAMQGDRELCTAAGMDDYVAKPIRVEELVAALERCRWSPEAGARGEPAGTVNTANAPSGRSPVMPDAAEPGSAAHEAAPVSPVIDEMTFARLTTTMGGAFVAELIDTSIEDGRELIAALRRALAERDIDSFRRAAHSLKSNSETLGAMNLAALARELETMARAGSLDGARDRIEPLVRAYEIATHTLEDLRRGLSA